MQFYENEHITLQTNRLQKVRPQGYKKLHFRQITLVQTFTFCTNEHSDVLRIIILNFQKEGN
jgi:hypothetical protein